MSSRILSSRDRIPKSNNKSPYISIALEAMDTSIWDTHDSTILLATRIAAGNLPSTTMPFLSAPLLNKTDNNVCVWVPLLNNPSSPRVILAGNIVALRHISTTETLDGRPLFEIEGEPALKDAHIIVSVIQPPHQKVRPPPETPFKVVGIATGMAEQFGNITFVETCIYGSIAVLPHCLPKKLAVGEEFEIKGSNLSLTGIVQVEGATYKVALTGFKHNEIPGL